MFAYLTLPYLFCLLTYPQWTACVFEPATIPLCPRFRIAFAMPQQQRATLHQSHLHIAIQRRTCYLCSMHISFSYASSLFCFRCTKQANECAHLHVFMCLRAWLRALALKWHQNPSANTKTCINLYTKSDANQFETWRGSKKNFTHRPTMTNNNNDNTIQYKYR